MSIRNLGVDLVRYITQRTYKSIPLTLIATLLVSSLACYAALITLPYTYVNGQVLTATELNSDLQTIYNDYNGNVTNANIASNAAISLSKLGLNPGQPAFDLQTTGLNCWGSGLTSDTDPRLVMTSDGVLEGGPGGTTTPDVGLQRSAAGTWQLTSPTGTPAVPVLDMNSGSIINASAISGSTAPAVNGGRIYMTSGVPVGDHALATSFYFGPYNGNIININGTLQTFSEVNYSLSGTATGIYDVYVTSSSPTAITISTSAWSGNTPPARGTDSTGRLTKTSAPGSLLVGAIEVNGSNQTADIPSSRWVSNLYNVVGKAVLAQDTTTSWTNTSTTPSAADANTTIGIGRISVLSVSGGLPVSLTNFCVGSITTYAAYIGIGVNSTSTASAAAYAGAGNTATGSCNYSAIGLVGLNYYQRLEWVQAGTATYTYSSAAAGFTGPGDALTGTIYN